MTFTGVGTSFHSGWRSPRDAPPDSAAWLGLRQSLDRPDATGAQRLLLAEFDSLAPESNPQFVSEALLGLAGRAERLGETAFAARLYSHLSADASVSGRAAERLAALRGEGAFGACAETLLRNSARQALDPTMLVGMTVAGTLARVTRLATLSRLAGSASSSTLTRILGARASANLLAFGVEALAFPAATRLGGLALGREYDWRGAALASETASSFLMLGALRFSGGVGRRLLGPHGIAEQGAVFGGLLISQKLEEHFGLREAGGNGVAQALSMMLQFQVAGRLSSRILPEGFRTWERGLEQAAERIAPPPRFPEIFSHPASLPALAGEPMRGFDPETLRNLSSQPLYMVSNNGGGDGKGGGDGSGSRPPTQPRPTLDGIGETGRTPAPGVRGGRRDTLTGLGDKSRQPSPRPTQEWPPAPPPPAEGPPEPPAETPSTAKITRPERVLTRSMGAAVVPPEPAPRDGKITQPDVRRSRPSEASPAAPGGRSSPTAITQPEVPPVRRSSPPQMRASSGGLSPRAHPPSADPMSAPSTYELQGLVDGIKYYRITGITPNPAEKIVEAIEQRLLETPAASFFEIPGTLDPREQGVIRVEVHRILRDAKLPPGTTVVVAIPESMSAILFSNRKGMNAVIVSLQAKGVRAPTPTVRPDPVLEASRRAPTKPQGRIGTSVRTPVGSPEAHAPNDPGGSQAVANNWNELRDHLRRFLSRSGSLPPTFVIRQQRGRIEERDLAALAYDFTLKPLPENVKITLTWSEYGGGRVSLQRIGDRFSAEMRGMRTAEQGYLYFPRNFERHELVLHKREAIRDYAYAGIERYEAEMAEYFAKAAAAFGSEIPMAYREGREEGSALRAARFSQLAQHYLKLWPQRQAHPELYAQVRELHQQLERAYTLLDFGGLGLFQERMGGLRLQQYEAMLANHNRETSTGAELLGFDQMPLKSLEQLPIPQHDHLREVFLKQLFNDSGGKRSPRETIAFLTDPVRLGMVLGATFRSRMSSLITRIARIPLTVRGGDLPGILQKSDLSPEAAGLRVEIEAALKDMGSFERLFLEHRMPESRAFLRAVFNGDEGIARLYREIHREWVTIPQDVMRRLGIYPLPSEEQIQHYIKGGIRPPPPLR